VIEVSEYKIELRLKNLLKFFFYHLSFFFAAPIAIVVISSLSGTAIVKNMLFWPNVNRTFILQFSIWIFNMALTYLMLFITPENVYFMQWASFMLYIVFRCFVVAVRYAYASKLRMKLLMAKA